MEEIRLRIIEIVSSQKRATSDMQSLIFDAQTLYNYVVKGEKPIVDSCN